VAKSFNLLIFNEFCWLVWFFPSAPPNNSVKKSTYIMQVLFFVPIFWHWIVPDMIEMI